MAQMAIFDVRFIDKVTRQTYKLRLVGSRSVVLEGDDSVQILLPISALNAYYELEPLRPPTIKLLKVNQRLGER